MRRTKEGNKKLLPAMRGPHTRTHTHSYARRGGKTTHKHARLQYEYCKVHQSSKGGGRHSLAAVGRSGRSGSVGRYASGRDCSVRTTADGHDLIVASKQIVHLRSFPVRTLITLTSLEASLIGGARTATSHADDQCLSHIDGAIGRLSEPRTPPPPFEGRHGHRRRRGHAGAKEGEPSTLRARVQCD